MRRMSLVASLGAAIAVLTFPVLANASPPAGMDASPEITSYTCGAATVSRTWSVTAAGVSWSVAYGDGISSGSKPISLHSISHTFRPNGRCIDYFQSFRAVDSSGGSMTDVTRVAVVL